MLNEFLQNEKELLEEILARFPELDRQEMLKPFWESPFLPSGTHRLLLLIDDKSDYGMFESLAGVAVNTFLAQYMKHVSEYLANELCLDVIVDDSFSRNGFKDIQEQFKKASVEDDMLAWFLDEGMFIIGVLRSDLRVDSIAKLAALVRKLDYHNVFLPEVFEPEVGYGYLYDVLTQLQQELKEIGLLHKQMVQEVDGQYYFQNIILDHERESFDAIQLVDINITIKFIPEEILFNSKLMETVNSSDSKFIESSIDLSLDDIRGQDINDEDFCSSNPAA